MHRLTSKSCNAITADWWLKNVTKATTCGKKGINQHWNLLNKQQKERKKETAKISKEKEKEKERHLIATASELKLGRIEARTTAEEIVNLARDDIVREARDEKGINMTLLFGYINWNFGIHFGLCRIGNRIKFKIGVSTFIQVDVDVVVVVVILSFFMLLLPLLEIVSHLLISLSLVGVLTLFSILFRYECLWFSWALPFARSFS